jgi:hypothetical protein
VVNNGVPFLSLLFEQDTVYRVQLVHNLKVECRDANVNVLQECNCRAMLPHTTWSEKADHWSMVITFLPQVNVDENMGYDNGS